MKEISPIIEKVLRYIHMHYYEHITLNQIASMMFMNPTYIGRLFRNEIGMSFNDYVVSYRITNAKKLLERRDLSIAEVARSVGYDSLNYFFKLFKESTGTTPSHYRTNIQQYGVSVDCYSIIKKKIQDYNFTEILSIDIPHSYPYSGAFISLPSGIYFIYTQYTYPTSEMMCINSIDDGKHWSSPYVLFQSDTPYCNPLGITQLNDGRIRIFYTEITDNELKLSAMTSFDEMHTWEKLDPSIFICNRPFYELGQILQLSNGNLILPVSYQRFPDLQKYDQPNSLKFYLSNDEGQNWQEFSQPISLGLMHPGSGLHAPTLLLDKSGLLHCYAATDLGCQYELLSRDSGKTWSQPHPTIFSSPNTGMGITSQINGNRIIVIDPIPSYSCYHTNDHKSRLICMMENNDGSWTKPFIFGTSDDSKRISFEKPILSLSSDFILVSYTSNIVGQRKHHFCLIPLSTFM